MQDVAPAPIRSESDFAALVDALAGAPDRCAQLTDLLRENHPVYDERGAATVVRMRGWVLLAIGRAEVSDAALVFLLEELDTGIDAYLVAAAARALRSYPRPDKTLAPFVMRALANIRYRDEPVSFESYGEYATSSAGTSPVRELLATLAWLGPHARDVLPELKSLRAQSGAFARKFRIDIDRAVHATRGSDHADERGTETCCTPPPGLTNTAYRSSSSRCCAETIESVVFEDQQGERITFGQFFRGQPSVVVFFYTRCDKPLKCSLTVTKLARIQKLLEANGLSDRIRTAAITYDPAYDLHQRLRVYGQDRAVRMDARHRLLRTPDGMDALCTYFGLGVNFIESLVNRHRIEAYILDADGRIAASFERLHLDEQEIAARAIELLKESDLNAVRTVGAARSTQLAS